MNTFTIKLIAIVLMLADHVGFFLYPQYVELRAIGRLSFPLFAWLIANGAIHTKNTNRYLSRLFIFGILSQIPYLIAERTVIPDHFGLNVFFTLFLGLLSIKIFRKSYPKILKIFLIGVCTVLAQIVVSSYGSVGVLSVLFFYIFSDNPKFLTISQTILYLPLWYLFIATGVIGLNYISLIEPLALFSLIIIRFYNGREGPKAKYLFYFFYPVQYLLFYIYKILF